MVLGLLVLGQMTIGSELDKKCKVIICSLRCINGLQKDINGCQLCKCVPPSSNTTPKMCPELPCFKYIKCAHGQVLDANGCRTCACKP
ncbi:unnamed protein product [Gordionus sp. m RMFG-2023]